MKHAALLLALLFAACDAFDAAEYAPEYVVEAYLAAGEPLPQLRLSRTGRVDEPYDFTRLAVSGADARIHLLAGDGSVVETYRYVEGTRTGIYEFAGEIEGPVAFWQVQPGATYRLEVTFPQNTDRVTAETTVPPAIGLGEVNADTVVYQSDDQYVLRVRRDPEAARQGFFIFSTEALDARVENLTPFARDLYEQGDVTLEDLRRGASPILNESNYDVENDTTLAVRFPWLGVLFYGPSRITASALDDNLYDFIRSQNVQQGGSTLSPGEIPNVLERVEGGTGVFGSLARATFDVYIARNPELE